MPLMRPTLASADTAGLSTDTQDLPGTLTHLPILTRLWSAVVRLKVTAKRLVDGDIDAVARMRADPIPRVQAAAR
jgi:hypothetical protein